MAVVDDLSTGRAGARQRGRVVSTSPTSAARPCSTSSGARSPTPWCTSPRRRRSAGRSRIPGSTPTSTSSGSINLLECCRQVGARRFVYVSTGGAGYGDTEVIPTPEDHPTRPLSPYGVSKVAAELYLGLLGESPRAPRDRSSPGQHLRSPSEPARGGRRGRHLHGPPPAGRAVHHQRRRSSDARLRVRGRRGRGRAARARSDPRSRAPSTSAPGSRRRSSRSSSDSGPRPASTARRGTARRGRASSGEACSTPREPGRSSAGRRA